MQPHVMRVHLVEVWPFVPDNPPRPERPCDRQHNPKTVPASQSLRHELLPDSVRCRHTSCGARPIFRFRTYLLLIWRRDKGSSSSRSGGDRAGQIRLLVAREVRR